LNKNIITIFIIALFVFSTICPISIGYNVKTLVVRNNGTTLYVGGNGPGNYTNIQDAIDDSSDGYTVFVYSGIYEADIIIDKSILLIGENQDTTIIEWGDDGISIYADGVIVTKFTIRKCGGFWHRCGIYIASDYNKISKVSIINNGVLNGIFLEEAFGNIVSENTIENNNYHGIRLQYSSFNIITDNKVSNLAAYGIVLSNSNNNEIYSNTASQCDWGGISVVSECNDNKLYHNNLIDNDISNGDDDGISLWDDGYPSGGNFWSDYLGEDNDSDGIGDTPYTIPGGINEDRYPLMNPWNNTAPDAPKIDGPTHGKIEVSYNYNFNSTDSDGDDIWYHISWGDKEIIYIYGPYPSGEEITLSYSWSEKGIFNISCWTRDICNEVSKTSTLEVKMPRDKKFNFYIIFFNWLVERFPILSKFLI
jgi:parallel beta-helix repeat protein